MNEDINIAKRLQIGAKTHYTNMEWQKKFLEAGTYETGTDLSCMVSTVSEILAEQKKELMDLLETKKLPEQTTEHHMEHCLGGYGGGCGCYFTSFNEGIDTIINILKQHD